MQSRSELLQQLLEVMKSTYCVMKSSGHPLGSKLDLTSTEMRILFHIVHVTEGISIKDLAKSINVSSSAATQFIDKLVKKKLVNREYDKTDRRAVRIYISKKVGKSFQDIKKQYFQRLQPLFADLTDTDINKLITLLSKIKAQDKLKI